MKSELARREPRPRGNAVIPRQLLAKERPTKLELAWVWAEPIGALASFASFALSIVLLSVRGPTPAPGRLVWTSVLVAALLATAVLVALACEFEGDNRRPAPSMRRTRALVLDRGRRCAPHAHERAARAPDVDYPQYSVTVDRQGGEIVVGVMRHSDGVGKRAWREHGTAPVGFDAASGTWGDMRPTTVKRPVGRDPDTGEQLWLEDLGEPEWTPNPERPWARFNGKDVRIAEPTVDRIALAVDDMGEVAAQLERQAYADALAQRKLERLALVFKPPPSGSAERAAVQAEDEWDMPLVD